MAIAWRALEVSTKTNWDVVEESVSGGTAPSITTTALPDGVWGLSYSTTIVVTGDEPITLEVTDGEIPYWTTLENGVISGGPAFPGLYEFTITATNAAGSDSQSLSILVPNEMSGEGDILVYNVLSGTVVENSDVTSSLVSVSEFPSFTGSLTERQDFVSGSVSTVQIPSLQGSLVEYLDTIDCFIDNPEAIDLYPKGGKKRKSLLSHIYDDDSEGLRELLDYSSIFKSNL